MISLIRTIVRAGLVVGLLVCAALLAMLPGCDELTTQVNNIERVDTTLGAQCLTCHGSNVVDDSILLPKGQWVNSEHASSALIESTEVLYGSTYKTNECGPECHTSQGFIEYVASGTRTTQSRPSVIGCFTCHAPHTGPYGSWKLEALRDSSAFVTLVDTQQVDMGKGNTCGICHRAVEPAPLWAATDTISGAWGPHFSPQTDVLQGGKAPFNVNSHSAVLNSTQNGCLACHYGSGRAFEFGEHTFRLENKLTLEQYAENCNVAGCHDNTTAERYRVGFSGSTFYSRPIMDSIALYASQIRDTLVSAGVFDANGLPVTDRMVGPDTARAIYNYLLYLHDGSRGVHNPKYIRDLLKASVDSIEN